MEPVLRTDLELGRRLHALQARVSLASLPPLMLIGEMGGGKKTYLKSLVRGLTCSDGYTPFADDEAPCGCKTCATLQAGECQDYAEVSSRTPIAELRDRLSDWAAFQPVVLEARILLVQRADRLTPAATDALLRLAEEPPANLRFLATAQSTHRVSAALLSRFHVLRLRQPEPGQLRELMAKTDGFREAVNGGGSFPFRSPGQLLAAHRMNFERCFKAWVLGSDFVSLEQSVQQFTRDAATLEFADPADVSGLFVEWLLWRFEQHCDQQKGAGWPQIRQHLATVSRLHEATFASHRGMPNPRGCITPFAQLYALISSLAMLRKLGSG